VTGEQANAEGAQLRLDIFNCHFAGGSFEKPQEVQKQKSDLRRHEFKVLNGAIMKRRAQVRQESLLHGSGCSVHLIVACGDFNCDPDPAFRAEFPESDESPEFQSCLFQDECLGSVQAGSRFRDVGETLGVTESSSRNAFRGCLKPGQGREVRFDRILVGPSETISSSFSTVGATRLVVDAAELVGEHQVALGRHSDLNSEPLPLFCSDHFGVIARLHLEAAR